MVWAIWVQVCRAGSRCHELWGHCWQYYYKFDWRATCLHTDKTPIMLWIYTKRSPMCKSRSWVIDIFSWHHFNDACNNDTVQLISLRKLITFDLTLKKNILWLWSRSALPRPSRSRFCSFLTVTLWRLLGQLSFVTLNSIAYYCNFSIGHFDERFNPPTISN
jgi:hypothetical protein